MSDNEPILINSQQSITVRDRHELNRPDDAMNYLEAKVRRDFEETCRVQGIAIDSVTFTWICRMEGHGVRGSVVP